MKLISTNPSKNYERIGEVTVSTKEEISKKVAEAREALPIWAGFGLDSRIKYIKKLISEFEAEQKDLAALMSAEMGMPIFQAADDLTYGIEFFQWYVDHAHECLDPEITYEDKKELHQVFREPRGVVAAIVPWNFPFSNFVWQTGQNLISGNTIVFKHSEETPLFGRAIEDIVNKSELPVGVFTEVYGAGEVGDVLVREDIDMICFTGSSKVGQYLYTVAASKMIPVLTELGGSAPGIFFEDADIDATLDTIYNNRFMNCGQICDGLKRLMVHQSRFDEVVAKLKTIIERKVIGEAEKKTTDIGPLVAKRQLELLEAQVTDAVNKGATIVTGGGRPEVLKGAYYLPTILTDITKDMRVFTEEVFGPVLPVIPFEDEAQAVRMANHTDYGLGGYIFTSNRERFDRVASQLKTGMVSQNNVSYVKAYNPFGGYKKSGLGREHGKYGFRELTQVKVVSKAK